MKKHFKIKLYFGLIFSAFETGRISIMAYDFWFPGDLMAETCMAFGNAR